MNNDIFEISTESVLRSVEHYFDPNLNGEEKDTESIKSDFHKVFPNAE